MTDPAAARFAATTEARRRHTDALHRRLDTALTIAAEAVTDTTRTLEQEMSQSDALLGR